MKRGDYRQIVDMGVLVLSEDILTHSRGALFEIVINRPDKRNALSLELWDQLDAALKTANRTPDVRAVLLRGEGKAFSAGIDLSSFAKLRVQYGEALAAKMRGITSDMQAVVNRLERLEIPTIALLHGFCLGMGLELALACDFRIGSTEVKLGLPEVLLGIIPDVGGTTRLTRLVGVAKAKELIMTGRQIDAAAAEKIGLLHQVVPLAQLGTAGEALAAELSQGAPLAVGMAKRVIDSTWDQERSLTTEGWAQSLLFQTADFQEGSLAMAQRRPPAFTGR